MISLAFSDIKEKIDILLNHSHDYKTNNLYDVIEVEIKKELCPLNGDNNHKINKEMKNYVSAARTINVLLRFFKFLRSMFLKS